MKNYENTDDDLFEVDKILGHRKINKKLQVKVRWSGYTEEDDTWEPKKNLLVTPMCALKCIHYLCKKTNMGGYKRHFRRLKSHI